MQYGKKVGGKPPRRDSEKETGESSWPITAPLVSSPLPCSPSHARRPPAPRSEPAALATQPASWTFSLPDLFSPGPVSGRSARLERVRAEVPRTWKRTGVSNDGRAVLPGTPARGRFAGAVHGAPLSAGEALLRGRTAGSRWIPVPSAPAAPNWFLAIQGVGRRWLSAEGGWLARRPRERVHGGC